MTNRKLFIVALLGAVLLVFAVHFLDFPGSVPNFKKVSGGGTLLDVKPSFSEEEIYQRFAGYGEEGRNNYAFRNRTVDVLLPLGVLPFLFLLMLHAVKRLGLDRMPRTFLLSLPFVYLLFDLAENGSVLALLSNFPDRMPLLANVLPYLTAVKRSASLLALVIPLLIFGYLLVRRPRGVALRH
jgi:hypothetical protein